MKLQRQHWVLLALVLFLTGQAVYYFWSHWGLITVHAKTTPLAQVIRSIEKQGHVTIKTNIDLTKPVFMNVDQVTLNEAMETLSTVMEGRWHLTYVVGPDKVAVNNALASFIASGHHAEGWDHFYVPLPPVGDDPQVLADPRKDSWVVKPAAEPTLHAYLEEASRNVTASFWVPETWNPAIKSPPKTGAIAKTIPKLVSAANGKYQEVITLAGYSSSHESEHHDHDPDFHSDGEPRYTSFGSHDHSAFDERVTNEINKLPPADRAAALAEREQRKKMFEDMKDLTPDQRMARFADMMNTPDMQDKMDSHNNQRDNRMSPSQRIARGGGYLSRVASANAAVGK